MNDSRIKYVKVVYPTVYVPQKSGRDFTGVLHGYNKDGHAIVEDDNGTVHVVNKEIIQPTSRP